MQEWTTLQRAGNIGSLDIEFFEGFPRQYFVVVDDKALIYGYFNYDAFKSFEVDVGEPIFVTDRTAENKILISKKIESFDSWFVHYHSQRIQSQQAPDSV